MTDLSVQDTSKVTTSQWEAFEFAVPRLKSGVLLFHAPGLGKTAITLFLSLHYYYTTCKETQCVVLVTGKNASMAWNSQLNDFMDKINLKIPMHIYFSNVKQKTWPHTKDRGLHIITCGLKQLSNVCHHSSRQKLGAFELTFRMVVDRC